MIAAENLYSQFYNRCRRNYLQVFAFVALIGWLRFCYRHPGRILPGYGTAQASAYVLPRSSQLAAPLGLAWGKNERPTGEIGVLKEVSRYSLLSSDGLTLVIEYNESAYMGLLLFDNFGFSRKLHDLLRTLRERPIAEIGSFDI